VSSNRGACPEVLGATGILFDPEDSIAGAGAVLRILRQPEVAKRLSEEGHERAKLFTWERTGRLTLEAYEYAARLIKDPRASSRQPTIISQGPLKRAAANAD
jgi:glycosyltransferase involved in cell wall biosynthesis